MSKHLATCPNCAGEMDVTHVGPYTRVRCPACDEELRVKTEVGNYRLVRRLAAGGMSVLFVGRDPTLERDVAIKLLNEEFSTDEERVRAFAQEARATAAVSHPNVVRVYTVGRAYDRHFIAMELVEGRSLEEQIAVHGALSEVETLALALQVVDGLRAAQSAGLVHRDVNPGNILIEENGTAKIVDFGIALLMEGGGAPGEELWASPHYVAPETLDRDGKADLRSDIYSLGATLYHALAGRPPLETKELSPEALREAKASVKPLREEAPWFTFETVRAVEKAMAYDPSDRYQSYEDFRSNLERVRRRLEAKGAHAPVHGTVRAQRRERQASHRKFWLWGSVALLVTLAAAGTYLFSKFSEPIAERPPISRMPLIGSEAYPTLDRKAASEMNAAYQEARKSLLAGEFSRAEGLFVRIRNHEQAPPEIAAWMEFEAALASFLGGRSGDARQHLRALTEFLVESGQEDTKQGRRLSAAIEVLTDLSFVPEDRIPTVLEDPYRAATFFSFALKAWEQGQLERARDMFARLVAAEPWNGGNWMNDYRSLARDYVADFERLRGVSGEFGEERREDLERAIANLEDVYKSLATQGRARFNVKARQSQILRRLRRWKEMEEGSRNR